MVLEEYCNYILSREQDLTEFSFPESNVKINKSDLINNMRLILRDNGNKEYDKLLVDTLMFYVSKSQLGKSRKFDENMESIISDIRKRVEIIKTLYTSSKRGVPFSYERVFEILIYYLRLITNILISDKDQRVCYVTAEISPEAVLFFLNRKLSLDSFDAEWEKKGWNTFNKDVAPFYTDMVENYIKYLMLSTYIRYCEIKNN